MKPFAIIGAAIMLALLSGCETATEFGPEGVTGGYSETPLAGVRWRVTFSANALTTAETAQTYWLFRSAQLALAKGYDGFRIVTPMNFTPNAGIGNWVGMNVRSDVVSGEIELIKKPFQPDPPTVFDAAALRDALSPYVNGNKCDGGNVCPHVHGYLFPIHPLG